MTPDDFLELVTKGEEQAALAALEQHPELAKARNAQGVSVVCLSVYRRLAKLAAALSALRSDLDLFEATCLGDLTRVLQIVSADPKSVNAVSPDGFGPVGYSAFFGHVAILRELIRRGGEVDVPSRNGMQVCPVHSAAAHSDQAKAVELSRIVLYAGADPNAQQQGGYTALHEAASNGNLALIDLLLDHAADPNLANDQGVTPVDLARSKGHEQAARLLERA